MIGEYLVPCKHNIVFDFIRNMPCSYLGIVQYHDIIVGFAEWIGMEIIKHGRGRTIKKYIDIYFFAKVSSCLSEIMQLIKKLKVTVTWRGGRLHK